MMFKCFVHQVSQHLAASMSGEYSHSEDEVLPYLVLVGRGLSSMGRFVAVPRVFGADPVPGSGPKFMRYLLFPPETQVRQVIPQVKKVGHVI